MLLLSSQSLLWTTAQFWHYPQFPR
jgi:hypothetical protein